MSSLSNLPYGVILDYWNEKLTSHRYRTRFILTKTVEILSFKFHSSKCSVNGIFADFPPAKPVKLSLNPSIAVVVPVFIRSDNDKTNIVNFIKTLENQTVKPNHIVLVDDGSPQKINISFPYHRLDTNLGPAHARNVGKKLALDKNADIIAFADSDCILSNTWIENILKDFTLKMDAHIISGNTKSFDKHWLGTYHEINGTLNGRRIKGSNRLLYGTTSNLAMCATVAKEVDFNECFPSAAGEDIEFCFRANQNGFSIKHVQDMIVYHNYGYSENIFKSLKRFVDLFVKYGKGEKILLKHIPNYYMHFDRTFEIPAESI